MYNVTGRTPTGSFLIVRLVNSGCIMFDPECTRLDDVDMPIAYEIPQEPDGHVQQSSKHCDAELDPIATSLGKVSVSFVVCIRFGHCLPWRS